MRAIFSLAVLFVIAGLRSTASAATTTKPAADVPAWTVSALGGYARVSDRFFYRGDSLADAPAIGLRFGRPFGESWALEAAGSYASTHGLQRAGANGADAAVANASAMLLAQLTPANSLGALYLGAGLGYTRYDTKFGLRGAKSNNLHFGTLETALGWKKALGERATFRLEARNLLNLPNKNFASAHLADQQFWGGFTYGFGGTAKDTDGDGVVDKRDQCPGTPAGATVNLGGCPGDADGDGVYDGIDQCPNTPAGAAVDSKGCPKDSDGDGVYDGIDQCADTPKGASVDAKGCPSDSDGDGVYDGLDQCPNTPKGAVVDAAGCPSDGDGDGVPDGLDQCPNTAAGLKVDMSGCPIEVTDKETQLLDTGMIRLQNVNFETGKSRLLQESFHTLDEVAAILLKWPQLQVEIGGHTDSRGSPGRNQLLSEDRAQAVKDYLVSLFPGLNAAQLTVKGYGVNQPLVRNSTPLNLAKNRRVEFKVVNREALKKEIERRRMLQK
jgi:outer membrane protein OmpA-like peptidoglycan-associated protein